MELKALLPDARRLKEENLATFLPGARTLEELTTPLPSADVWEKLTVLLGAHILVELVSKFEESENWLFGLSLTSGN